MKAVAGSIPAEYGRQQRPYSYVWKEKERGLFYKEVQCDQYQQNL